MENMQMSVFDDARQYVQPAGAGLRFVNYLVDMIVFYAVFFISMFLLGIIAVSAGGDGEAFALFLNSITGKIIIWLSTFAMLVLVYTFIEGVTKGRSLGKLITSTIALREDGAAISWKDALMRSLCRCIPFETFSGFSGYPWHDKLTKTMVVKKQAQ